MSDDPARRAKRRRQLGDWGVVIIGGLVVTVIGIVSLLVITAIVFGR